MTRFLRETPDTLGGWVDSIVPDYLGLTHGGRWVCLITWRNEHETPEQDSFIWALGYALDPHTARQVAIDNLVEQRTAQLVWELTI